jgi:hypothetical protein
MSEEDMEHKYDDDEKSSLVVDPPVVPAHQPSDSLQSALPSSDGQAEQ